MKRESVVKVLVALMLIGIAGRVAVSLAFGNSVGQLPGISDQNSYHTLAVRVLTGKGYSFPTDWWPLTPANAPTGFWSYLYTLFLAGLYTVFGIHPLAPRLVQSIAGGVLMPLLAYRLGRRAFSEEVGLVAAGWVALYGYFVYYAAALMTETFYIIGILWCLDCAQRIAGATIWGAGSQTSIRNPQSAIRNWIELGLVIAFTAYLRQVFLLFVPFIFIWLLWVGKGQTGRATNHPVTLSPPHPLTPSPPHRATSSWVPSLRGWLVTIVVTAALIAPATLFNYRQFGRFVLLNTNAGYALFWANHPIYGDQFVPILTEDMPSYQDLIPVELRGLNEAELDSELMRRGIGFVLADPARYMRLSFSRLPAYFKFWPSPDSSLLSNIVRVGSFGLALPFMLIGLGMWIADGLRREENGGLRSPGALLLLFAFVYSAVHLLSWSLIRYRLPVDAVMLVFAARGLLGVAGWLPVVNGAIRRAAVPRPHHHRRHLVGDGGRTRTPEGTV